MTISSRADSHIFLLLIALFITQLLRTQNVAIPDAAFKSALVTHTPVIDTNGDGEIQISEAVSFNGDITISGTASNPGNIADLTGIEEFINIEGLECSYQQITSLDLSSNGNIESLTCNENPLNTVDLSGSPLLSTVSFSGHQLSVLDVSNNNQLLLLQCNFGSLKNLSLGSQPNLQFLYVQDNNLSFLDLTSAPSLVALLVEYNQLAQLNLGSNPLLTYLYCRNNNLENLDVSNNPDLVTLHCKSNPELSYINLQNGANDNLDISGMPSNTSNFEDLPSLSLVCVDELNSPLTTFISNQSGQSVTYIVECILGNETQEKSNLVLHPLPVSDILEFRSDNQIISVSLYNVLGELLFSTHDDNGIISCDLSSINSGLYIMVFGDIKGNRMIRKIVKD